MRDLTEGEKVDVKKMYESKWFKIMESLLDWYKMDIFNDMIDKPLGDKVNIELITQKQNKYLWAKTFVEKVRSSTAWIWKRKD